MLRRTVANGHRCRPSISVAPHPGLPASLQRVRPQAGHRSSCSVDGGAFYPRTEGATSLLSSLLGLWPAHIELRAEPNRALDYSSPQGPPFEDQTSAIPAGNNSPPNAPVSASTCSQRADSAWRKAAHLWAASAERLAVPTRPSRRLHPTMVSTSRAMAREFVPASSPRPQQQGVMAGPTIDSGRRGV